MLSDVPWWDRNRQKKERFRNTATQIWDHPKSPSTDSFTNILYLYLAGVGSDQPQGDTGGREPGGAGAGQGPHTPVHHQGRQEDVHTGPQGHQLGLILILYIPLVSCSKKIGFGTNSV